MTQLLTKQPQNSHQIAMIDQLDLQQLDQVVGGLAQTIPTIHKATDVTLKRGIIG